jgi:chromosome segregation ATPase
MLSKLLPWTSKTAPVSPQGVDEGVAHVDEHERDEKNTIMRIASTRLSVKSFNDNALAEASDELKHIVGDLQQKLRNRAHQLTNLAHEKDFLAKENEEVKHENESLKMELQQSKELIMTLQQKIHDLQMKLPETSDKQFEIQESSTKESDSFLYQLTSDSVVSDLDSK